MWICAVSVSRAVSVTVVARNAPSDARVAAGRGSRDGGRGALWSASRSSRPKNAVRLAACP